MSTTSGTPSSEDYEAQHVHSVYDQIAPHFSSTRYKPWPIVQAFLATRLPGSLGIDAGCGNGKYLSVNHDIFIIASDRSAPLVSIAHENHVATPLHQTQSPKAPDPNSTQTGAIHTAPNHRVNRSARAKDVPAKPQPGNADVAVADVLGLPHASGAFDFALSIAVIHHLSSRSRRIAAIKEVLRVLRSGNGNRDSHKEIDNGETVASQDRNSNITVSRTDDIDTSSTTTNHAQADSRTLERIQNISSPSGQALIFVWALEQANSRRGWDAHSAQDVMVPWVLQEKRTGARGQKHGSHGACSGTTKRGARTNTHGSDIGDRSPDDPTSPCASDPNAATAPSAQKTFHRFYHLYQTGELEADVLAAGGRVRDGGYERDNWWAIVECGGHEGVAMEV